MTWSEIAVFFGRFHPLVVHLPIGFLVLAFLMWFFEKWKKKDQFRPAISFALLLGTLSAVAACILGFLLSSEGGYDDSLKNQHMWAGILTTLVSGFTYWIYSFKTSVATSIKVAAMIMLMIGLSATGHIGGSLTHGSDYLTEYAPFGNNTEGTKPVALEERIVFEHAIQPILKKKCSSCHRSGKQKGELSFASAESFINGGKGGPVFVNGHAKSSELVKRVSLHPSHDDFMPPEGKTPLTPEEIMILTIWIDSGAPFDTKLIDLSSNELKIAITDYYSLTQEANESASFETIDEETIATLESDGFVIRQLIADQGLYDVTLRSISDNRSKQLQQLTEIADHIVWLNLSGLDLNSGDMTQFPTMPNLEKLRMENNRLVNEDLKHLKAPKLQTINLNGNQLSNEVLEYLREFKYLQRVYLWQTNVIEPPEIFFEIIL